MVFPKKMKPEGICSLELRWNVILLLFSFLCIGSEHERLICLQDSDMERPLLVFAQPEVFTLGIIFTEKLIL